MSRRGRTGILLALLGLGLLVFGILLVSSVLRTSLTPRPLPTSPPPVTEKVVVVTHDMALGSVLRVEDLNEVDVPVELAPVASFSSREEVAGRMTKIPLVAGEMLLPHHLADPTNVQHDLAFVLEQDQVLMAFPADDLMSRMNLLQPGDRVDILVSLEQELSPEEAGLTSIGAAEDEGEETRLFTFDALQRVGISAVLVEIVPVRNATGVTGSAQGAVAAQVEGTPVPTPTPAPSQVETYAVLVALAPQDALVLKHMKDAGGIVDIVLRNPTSEGNFELEPVMPEYLRDRYRLEINR